MDETEKDNKLCNHCKKEIALLNFALHESHCQRFLSLCPDCNEPIPRDQMEEHRSEQHTLVRCTQCSKKMERCHLQEHQSEECVGRMLLCRFCHLEVASRDLEEHTVACSSRTERCPDCGHYVQLRDREDHALQCSTSPVKDGGQDTAVPTDKQKSTLQLCFSCMKSYPSDRMWEHQRDCSALSPPGGKEDDVHLQNSQNTNSLVFTFSQRDSKALVKSDVEAMDQIGTCLQCHLALPVATLQWHEVKCQAFERLKKKDKLKSPIAGDGHKQKSVLKW
ncbi:XIAP-associated factor 1 isoform X2 [Scleropages formosus]|uniref:TRAF-type domain-containing protein n=1 Tax=Scleropages formosus TaxID=113540 RepID=A0A8C9RYP9_SCLFO|nr:XIAP-associated factor 1 isoform X2 [Scleropages formosus]